MAEEELPIMSEEQVNIFKAIDIFIKRFRIFIVFELEKVYPNNWATEFRNALQCPPPNHKQKNWDKSVRQNDNIVSIDFIDFQYLELFASNKKEFLKPIFKDDRFHLPTWFNEIANVRNLTSHFTFDKLTNDEKDLAWIRMKNIAEYMNDAELLTAITSLRDNRPISKKNNETLVPKKLILSRKKIFRSILIIALVVCFFTLFYNLFYYPSEIERMLEKDTTAILNNPKYQPPKSDHNNSNTSNIDNSEIAKENINQNQVSIDKYQDKHSSKTNESKQEDFSSYVNTSILNTVNTDISVGIMDESGSFSPLFSANIATIYNNVGNNATTGLIKNSFIHKPEFKGLMEGNSDIIKKLDLANRTDYLALGEIKFSMRNGTLEIGTIVCTASISINIIDTKSENVVKSFSISDVNGNGVTESQAKEKAIQKLLYTYSNQYSSL